MDKRDVYEHLAKIYLDASQKKKRKGRKYLDSKNSLFILIAFILGFGLFFLTTIPKRQHILSTSLLLMLQPDTVKINFDFNPAKKEVYSIDLNHMNINRYDELVFSLKKTNYRDTVSVRVEFTNAFNEKAEVYLKDISYKWQDYKVPFSDFGDIRDWSDMSKLSFIVEEWNVTEDNGIVYIAGIGVSR